MTSKATSVRLSQARVALKRTLKAALAPFGSRADPASPTVRTLFYHRVNDYPLHELGPVSRELSVSTESFDDQLRELRRQGFRSASMAEFCDMIEGHVAIDPRAVLLTFDDGYADNLEYAAPILARHGYTATVFIVADALGRNNLEFWPDGDQPGRGRFMNRAELAAWLDDGHEVGAHTLTHPMLTTLDDRRLDCELRDCRAKLEELVGRPVIALAYPGGDYDGRVETAARRAGYRAAFTTRPGPNGTGAPMMRLNRTEVSASDPIGVFRSKLEGRLDWTAVRDSSAYRAAMRAMNDSLGSLMRTERT